MAGGHGLHPQHANQDRGRIAHYPCRRTRFIGTSDQSRMAGLAIGHATALIGRFIDR